MNYIYTSTCRDNMREGRKGGREGRERGREGREDVIRHTCMYCFLTQITLVGEKKKKSQRKRVKERHEKGRRSGRSSILGEAKGGEEGVSCVCICVCIYTSMLSGQSIQRR